MLDCRHFGFETFNSRMKGAMRLGYLWPERVDGF